MSWYDESEYEKRRTREWLAEQFPAEGALVIATFDVAWSGWEYDWKGALVSHGGVPELVIVDGTSMTGNIPDELEQRVREYRRMADETEAALRRYRELGGLFGDAWQEATNARHQRVIALERREEETEVEHEARIALWAGTGVGSDNATSDGTAKIDPLSRPAVVSLELSERPKREATEELTRLGEEAGSYDPAAIEVLRDLKPLRERPRNNIGVGSTDLLGKTQDYVLKFPLIPGDEHMRKDDIELKYSMLHALSYLNGGVHPSELDKIGLRDAWEIISKWVDDTRAGR